MFNVLLEANTGAGNSMGTIIMLVLFMAIFWFLIIRPQKKKEQQTKDMQNALAKGDKVTTIGGIVGTVLSVNEDNVVIESGSDKAQLVFKKWAIGAVESKKVEKKEEVEEVKETKPENKSKKFGKKAKAEEAAEEVVEEVTETTAEAETTEE